MSTLDSVYIQENISTKASLSSWLVCLSAGLFFFYEFIQMNMLNSLGSYLVNEYAITATQLGDLSAWYFYSTVLFLFTAGSLLDRFSTRRIILVGMSFCVIGTFLFAISKSLFIIAICRFFTGIGSAFCFLSCIRLASRWFPPRQLASITGIIVTMAMLGGIVAQTPMTLLASAIGWRSSLLVDAALGLVITLIVWLFVQDYPPTHQKDHAIEQQKLQKLGFWHAIQKAFLNRQNWLAGIYTCFLNLPISLLGALWGSSFLQEVNHFSATDASYATSMIFLGTVVGGPFAGWMSDRIGLRRTPMLVGAIASLAIILTIIYTTNLSLYFSLFLFLLLGFASSTQVLSYPTIAEGSPKILTATSVSVVSITTIGGYAVFQPLFGRIMDWHWSGQMLNHVRLYTADDYRFAIMIMPIAFLIGLVAAWALKETYCKQIG